MDREMLEKIIGGALFDIVIDGKTRSENDAAYILSALNEAGCVVVPKEAVAALKDAKMLMSERPSTYRINLAEDWLQNFPKISAMLTAAQEDGTDD